MKFKQNYEEYKNIQYRKISTTLKVATACAETLFAIPILGAVIIIGNLYMPLLLVGIFHIISIFVGRKYNRNVAGNAIGFIGCIIGVLPLLGWLIHLVAAIVSWYNIKE